MPLTKSEILEFRRRLEELRDEMTKLVRGVSEEVKSAEENKGYSQHQADEGTDDFGRRITLEVSSKEQDILKQIERAFEKMDENTYGICDVTGKEIPKKRLEAIPYANMTVEAQDMLEKGLLQ